MEILNLGDKEKIRKITFNQRVEIVFSAPTKV
jgi:hypothetical protein